MVVEMIVAVVAVAVVAEGVVGDEAVTKHEPITNLKRQMRYPGGDGKVARRSGTV